MSKQCGRVSFTINYVFPLILKIPYSKKWKNLYIITTHFLTIPLNPLNYLWNTLVQQNNHITIGWRCNLRLIWSHPLITTPQPRLNKTRGKTLDINVTTKVGKLVSIILYWGFGSSVHTTYNNTIQQCSLWLILPTTQSATQTQPPAGHARKC